MQILETLTKGKGEFPPYDRSDFCCEVWQCPNEADYYVDDFDGEMGYICKQCYEDIQQRNIK